MTKIENLVKSLNFLQKLRIFSIISTLVKNRGFGQKRSWNSIFEICSLEFRFLNFDLWHSILENFFEFFFLVFFEFCFRFFCFFRVFFQFLSIFSNFLFRVLFEFFHVFFEFYSSFFMFFQVSFYFFELFQLFIDFLRRHSKLCPILSKNLTFIFLGKIFDISAIQHSSLFKNSLFKNINFSYIFWLKILFFCQKWNLWLNRSSCQKSLFWSNVETLFKNRKFSQKLKCLSKI